MAVNGPKVNATDDYCTVPTIPSGTEIILLSSAAYETQKFIAPSTIVPVPERMYLQKQLCNSIVSDYFAAQKKRIQFNKSQIAEAILRQFRLRAAAPRGWASPESTRCRLWMQLWATSGITSVRVSDGSSSVSTTWLQRLHSPTS